MTDPAIFHSLLDYVGFGEEDARVLAALGSTLEPSFGPIIDDFYRAIVKRPDAMAVFAGGAPQIARQKVRLREWLEELFSGVYDDAYFERRARIGRTHVQIALPQHFMFGAMSLVRAGLHDALARADLDDGVRTRGQRAIDRICDVEIAIMLETYRERLVEQQRGQERLATLGQLAASVGHELRNPLAVMSTSLHLLRRRIDDPKATHHADKIQRQIGLANRIVTDLLAIVRDRTPQRTPVDLPRLIEEVIDGTPNPHGIPIRVQLERGMPRLLVDRLQIRQVLANLLANAFEAQDGVARPQVVIEATREASRLHVAVLDAGRGIPEEVRKRMFEPLMTTRDTGVGLGLALCERLVEAHGGAMIAENRDEGGARVGFTLPEAFVDTPPEST